MKQVRSARGEVVNFELLAIKQQLANMPVPKKVEERKTIIQQKVKPSDKEEEVSSEEIQQSVENQKPILPKRK